METTEHAGDDAVSSAIDGSVLSRSPGVPFMISILFCSMLLFLLLFSFLLLFWLLLLLLLC